MSTILDNLLCYLCRRLSKHLAKIGDKLRNSHPQCILFKKDLWQQMISFMPVTFYFPPNRSIDRLSASNVGLGE